jgi:hypothetical protein
MASITLRSVKGSALTFAEGDANFTNLNDDKIELTDLSVGAEGTASGDGAIAYNNTTGVFTYTPPDLSGYLTSYTETDPVVGAVTGIVKADGAGNISAAVAGTDYIASETFTSLVQDTTPQLGGALDCQGNDVRDATLEDYKETIHALGSTDTPTITISNGNVQSVTISSGLALPAFADAAAGQSVTLLVSGSGSATGTGAYKFAGGNKTLTTSSVVSIFYDGTTYWTSIATGFAA